MASVLSSENSIARLVLLTENDNSNDVRWRVGKSERLRFPFTWLSFPMHVGWSLQTTVMDHLPTDIRAVSWTGTSCVELWDERRASKVVPDRLKMPVYYISIYYSMVLASCRKRSPNYRRQRSYRTVPCLNNFTPRAEGQQR